MSKVKWGTDIKIDLDNVLLSLSIALDLAESSSVYDIGYSWKLYKCKLFQTWIYISFSKNSLYCIRNCIRT